MVGIQGRLGDVEHAAPHPSLSFTGDERCDTYAADDFGLAVLTHERSRTRQPSTAGDGTIQWWVRGAIYGVETSSGVRSVERRNGGRVLAELFEEEGPEAAARLNGTFVAVGYDADDGRAYVVTDRIGSHPLYYARTEGGLVFSTHVQSLPAHPAVDADVDVDSLAEYCSLGHVPGVETPLEGVQSLPPSSVTTIDLDSLEFRTERYWSPHYDPEDESFETFAARYAETLAEVMRDRLVPGRRYGFLVSGGSDSRLLLDIATEILPADDIIVYHLSDWMSDEARAAERAALTAGVEFRWLRRDEEYQSRMLSGAAPMMNFQGRTEQAHAVPYADQLREEVDCLVTGLYADTFFEAMNVGRHSIELGPLGTFHSLTTSPVRTVDDYLERYDESAPAYLDVDRSIREIMRERLDVREDGTVVDHGVTYPSLRDLSLYGGAYPLWTDADLFYWSLEQTMPHWTPFLDNRMLDLATSVPLRFQLRRNLSNAALRHRESPLAEFPLSSSGLSPSRSFLAHFVGARVSALARRVFEGADPPQPYFTNRPWTNVREVLNYQPFVGDALRRHQPAIREAPFLDWDGVLDVFRAHLDHEVSSWEPYTLLSFLETPLFAELLGESAAGAAPTVSPNGVAREAATARDVPGEDRTPTDAMNRSAKATNPNPERDR